MNRLKFQNERFHGLIGKMKLDKDEKKALVKEVSAGRCTSSKDLTAQEMQQAIQMLEGNWDSRIKKMQAKARAIANDLGILKMVNGKADYSALNTFILKTCKKANLFQLEYKELAVCITALERWRDSNTKRMVKDALKSV